MDRICSKLTSKNIIKYIIQGVVVAIASYILPNRKIHNKEVLLIAIMSSITFFILDVFTNDTIYKAAEIGVGVKIAENLLLL